MMIFKFAVTRVSIAWPVLGFVAVHLLGIGAFGQAGIVSIRGTIRGDDGKPISGAAVHVAGTNIGGVDAQTVTATDGTYSLSVPVSGKVSVCAQKVEDGYAPSCLFEPVLLDLSVQRASTIPQDIELQRTTRLEIIIDDPAEILRTTQGAPFLALQLITPSNLIYPMHLTANSAKSRTYTFNVPKNQAVRLAYVGSGVRLKDDKASSIWPADAPRPLQSQTGEPVQQLRFQAVRE